ncbi:MAG: 6-phosphogluconolactonase [Bermanella sp.]
MMRLNEFKNTESCNAQLSHVLAEDIDQVLSKKAVCNIAVAGGNTPKALYELLSKLPIPWEKVQVTLSDERWVDVKHNDSNEKMVRTELLINHAKKSRFIPLKNAKHSPSDAIALCDTNLKHNMPTLDVVVLGMGDDGHFASVFPNIENLQVLLDLQQIRACQAVCPPGKDPRMSLTLAYLLTARKIYLLIFGQRKKNIISSVSLGNSLSASYPVAALINQQVCPVEVYWSP